MCGIAGLFGTDSSAVSRDLLKRMTDSLVHRGPDAEGYFISDDGKLGLGHRRLAVIDLSENAGQPMSYLDRYVITYNGEIYNYRELRNELQKKGYNFRSLSDTEVLLALYDLKKENCLAELDGMFSFAIYDKLEKKLFCARDRFGEKPFYYHYQPGKGFAFASEMKALFAAGIVRKVNPVMLCNFLVSGYVDNPDNMEDTFFENICKLPSAHYFIIDNSLRLQKKKYWNIDTGKNTNLHIEEVYTQIGNLMVDSVGNRLRSDVPVGTSLSGGIDSSIVVSIISELNKEKTFRQKTFSARFPGFEKDEGKYMDILLSRVKADPHFVTPGAQDLIDRIDKIFYHQEEPFLSSSIVAQYEVMRLARQNNVTVLLDGQGADEVFAGYPYYFRYYFEELFLKNKKAYKEQLNRYAETNGSDYRRDIKFWMQVMMGRNYKQLATFKRIRYGIAQPDLGHDFFASHKKHLYAVRIRTEPDLGMVMKDGVCGESMEQILRHADRNSMAHSVEVRLPFLSHKLVELAFQIPCLYKMYNGWTKYPLRKAFEKILPAEIAWRKDKVGFEPPQKKWMQEKRVQEKIKCSKEFLVKEQILDRKVLDKQPSPESAVETIDNSWKYWMAGKLFEH